MVAVNVSLGAFSLDCDLQMASLLIRHSSYGVPHILL